jgi:hypothetical protein
MTPINVITKYNLGHYFYTIWNSNENHIVYRDGGTTYFDMIVDGVTHKFYSPTPFNPELEATLDGNAMRKMDDETLRVLIVALGIELETKNQE